MAPSSRDAKQVRRLLALATIYRRGLRSDAAQFGAVGLQTVCDWVLRFKARGPDDLIDALPPGGRRCLMTHSARPWRRCPEQPDPGIARCCALAIGRSGAVGLGRVRD